MQEDVLLGWHICDTPSAGRGLWDTRTACFVASPCHKCCQLCGTDLQQLPSCVTVPAAQPSPCHTDTRGFFWYPSSQPPRYSPRAAPLPPPPLSSSPPPPFSSLLLLLLLLLLPPPFLLPPHTSYSTLALPPSCRLHLLPPALSPMHFHKTPPCTLNSWFFNSWLSSPPSYLLWRTLHLAKPPPCTDSKEQDQGTETSRCLLSSTRLLLPRSRDKGPALQVAVPGRELGWPDPSCPRQVGMTNSPQGGPECPA